MFKVVKEQSTVYLLGSIHKLPPKSSWCNPAIGEALGKADVFFFETNLDFATTEFHYFMDKKGYLPRGQTLVQKLSPPALKEYNGLIRTYRIDRNMLDFVQPGVAFLLLQSFMPGVHIVLTPGVDARITNYARDHGKQIGYLESLQSQFEVMTSIGGGAQVAILEKALTDTGNNDSQFRTMFTAWGKGDLQTLRTLHDKDPDGGPEQTALLLDKRNAAWIPRIEMMLNIPKTHLVTVGAMHLAGPKSVIDLLCGKGLNVERIQAGAKPTSACPAARQRLTAAAAR